MSKSARRSNPSHGETLIRDEPKPRFPEQHQRAPGVEAKLKPRPRYQGLSAEQAAEFGKKTPMGRPAQPEELAPTYVFLASDADSSFITGTVVQVAGGEIAG